MPQKLKHVDLFKNVRGQYEMLENLTDEFAGALKRQKIESKTYDTEDKTLAEISTFFAKNPPDCTIGFNFFMAGKPIHSDVPHIAFMVDSATYYPELMQAPSVIAAMSDQDSVDFLKMFGKKQTLFFPLALDLEMVSEKKNNEIMSAKRDLDVVFAGSFVNSDSVFSRWQDYFSKELVKLLDEIAEKALQSGTESHILAAFKAFQTKPQFLQELKEKQFGFLELVNSIEQVIRGRDKINLFNALADQQIHMFVSNEDVALWQKALKKNANLKFHPQVSFKELFSIFKRAKVVINSMPQVKRGFHEQQLLALSQGASSLTNENVLLRATFSPGFEILYFLAPNYAKVSSSIQGALSNEAKRLDDVMKAREVIRNFHTWDARVKMLEETLPELLQAMKTPK